MCGCGGGRVKICWETFSQRLQASKFTVKKEPDYPILPEPCGRKRLGQQILDAVSSSLNYPKAHLLLLWPCCLSLAIYSSFQVYGTIINKIYIGTWQIRPFPNLADRRN
jgi:hypothetical protein